jgi:GINS complex subunit 2
LNVEDDSDLRAQISRCSNRVVREVAMESSAHAAAGQTAFQKAEFLAEDELIEISPTVKAGVVRLVCGEFGPFEPSVTTQVPLWLALALKKVRRCKIIPPRWLQLRNVEKITQDERDDDGQLQPLPRFFSEIAALLLHNAVDDIESASRLRRAVEDLTSVRAGKMRRWMQTSVRERVNAIKLNNLTSLEVETQRPVLTRVLEGLYAIHVPELDVDLVTQSNTDGTSTAAANESESRPAPRELRRVIRRT